MSRFPSLGSNLHPDRGNYRLGVTPTKRCRFCRFPNDVRSTAWGKQGEGNVSNGSNEMVAKSGCAFCGSKNWHKGKPPKLPDDRDMPSRENLRKRR